MFSQGRKRSLKSKTKGKVFSKLRSLLWDLGGGFAHFLVTGKRQKLCLLWFFFFKLVLHGRKPNIVLP